MERRRGAVLLAMVAALGAASVPAAVARSAQAEGQVDLSFGSCGISTVMAQDPETGDENPRYASGGAIAVQSDGKILTAGKNVLIRRLGDGSVDYGFGSSGMVYGHAFGDEIARLAVQPDGRIVVVGTTSELGTGTNNQSYFARYLASGAVDTTFGTAGKATTSAGRAATVALQSDGRILVAGGHTVMRLLSNGSLDPSFGSSGTVTLPFDKATAVAAQPDGKVVVGISVIDPDPRRYDFGVLRLNADGSSDTTFSAGQMTRIDVGIDELAAMAVDSAGRIVIGGSSSVDGRPQVTLVRLLSDAALDTSFGDNGVSLTQLTTTPAVHQRLQDLVLQPDDKPVVVADLVRSDSGSVAMARFTVGGRLDPTFGTEGQTVIPTGSPAAGGDFNRLARLPNGDFVVGNALGGGSVIRFRAGPLASTPLAVTALNCTKRITVSPGGSVDYGIPPARKSTPRAYTVTNTGTAPVRVARLTFVNGGRFAVVADSCTTAGPLQPRSSCHVVLSRTGTGPAVDGAGVSMSVRHDAERGWHSVPLLTSPIAGVRMALGAGWNGVGQVGAVHPAGSPGLLPVGLTDVATVAAGYFHSLAVRQDGSVWAWGWNAVGQLGDGTTADRHTPVRVPGLSDIAMVAAGAHSSFAVSTNGTVYAWGWNATGQLGDGTTVDRHVPVRLTRLPRMASVSGGAFHTLAVAADHTAWSWGWNGFGQLGDGTTVDHYAPQRISGMKEVKQVAAGMFHSLAADLLGRASAWGWNGAGQLGDGTTTDRSRPGPVTGLMNAVGFIAAGAHHSLAVHHENVVAWGWNALGQLGDGTFVDRHTPIRSAVPHAPFEPVRTVAAGVFHSFATTWEGPAWAWGWNALGQLSFDPVTQTFATPARMDLRGPRPIAGGFGHSLAS